MFGGASRRPAKRTIMSETNRLERSRSPANSRDAWGSRRGRKSASRSDQSPAPLDLWACRIRRLVDPKVPRIAPSQHRTMTPVGRRWETGSHCRWLSRLTRGGAALHKNQLRGASSPHRWGGSRLHEEIGRLHRGSSRSLAASGCNKLLSGRAFEVRSKDHRDAWCAQYHPPAGSGARLCSA